MTEIADEKRFMIRYPGSGMEFDFGENGIDIEFARAECLRKPERGETAMKGQSMNGCSGADLGIH